MFLDFGVKDAIDIILVALLLYYLYRLMRVSRSLNVFIGIMVFVVIWLFVSRVLEMRLLGSILDKLVSVGAIGIVILFQDDIRKFLYNLGAHRRVASLVNFFSSSKRRDERKKQQNDSILPIVRACQNMARGKVGALIVMERNKSLEEVVVTGDLIDSAINQRLIENIFFKNSPLHDGGMIIVRNRIKAAACILPVSHDLHIPKEYGLRHRAALGISQETDAVAIVVSEETGRISVAINGKLNPRLSAEDLESILSTEMAVMEE
ncbi:MAG: diadenylate cyclase CdaA [Prevotella sp.]|nr:diadenylate cyclase CdaA [Prevotella sp.]